MKQVVKERKDIAFYIMLYPLPMHKGSYEVAKAIQCKKSLELLDDAYQKKAVPKASCDTKVIDKNMELARKLGISGTPGIIFPDGRLIPGYIDAKTIIKMLENK